MRVWVRGTALAVIALVAGCTGPTGAKPVGGPASVRVSGKAVPYAGAVPWSDAVGATADPRQVDIYADGDRIHGSVCGLPIERVMVTESPTRVTISVAGYAAPLGAGQACAGVGHQPQLQHVTIPGGLGGRLLIDSSDGAAHPVLNASLTPSLRHVPSGYLPQAVQWDQSSGIVTRLYRHGDMNGRPLILLTRGIADAVDRDPPSGHVTKSTSIGGSPAKVWHYTDRYNDITTVQWAAKLGILERLTAVGTPTDHLPSAQVIDLARSVRQGFAEPR